MKVLMIIPGLQTGGAETLFVRLACALKARGHLVVVSLFRRRGDDATLVNTLRQAGVPVYVRPLSSPRFYRLLYKLSAEIEKRCGRFNLVEWLHGRHLGRLQARYSFDAVNAHLIPAQRIACVAFGRRPPRIVGSDHGDWRWQKTAGPAPDLEAVARRLDVLVCPCEDNLRRVELYPWAGAMDKTLIYYGYELPPFTSRVGDDKEKVFTFGMIARGSERDKGWEEAVQAFLLARKRAKRPVRLVLVGAGDAVEKAKTLAGDLTDGSIVFAGYHSEPESLIASFDVALLPTCYGPESLPCVIIECLAQGKPVISTPIGGIPEMLKVDGEEAGALVALSADGRASVDELSAAMVRLAEDDASLVKARRAAGKAALRFEMSRCVDQYESVLRADAGDTQPAPMVCHDLLS